MKRGVTNTIIDPLISDCLDEHNANYAWSLPKEAFPNICSHKNLQIGPIEFPFQFISLSRYKIWKAIFKCNFPFVVSKKNKYPSSPNILHISSLYLCKNQWISWNLILHKFSHIPCVALFKNNRGKLLRELWFPGLEIFPRFITHTRWLCLSSYIYSNTRRRMCFKKEENNAANRKTLGKRLLTPGRTNDPQSWRFQLYQSHARDIAATWPGNFVKAL